MRRFMIASTLTLLLAAVASGAASAATAKLSLRGVFAGPIASHHGSRWKLFAQGKRAGTATFRCRQRACVGTFKLARGSIRARISIDPSKASDRGSIIGGTGAYRHARGWFTLRPVTVKSVVFTIHVVEMAVSA